MEKRRLLGIFDMLAIIVTEILPIGVRMTFSNGVDETVSMRSYFSLLPFGYGMIQPLIISLISLFLLALWVCGMVFEAEEGFYKFLAFLSGTAVIIWFTQAFIGFGGLTFAGVLINILLIAATALAVYEVRALRRQNET